MKNTFWAALMLSVLSLGCTRSQEDANEITCKNMQLITLTGNGPVTIGEPIHFSAPEVGGYRIYSWTGPNHFTSQEPDNTIDYAELKHEGWYYMSVSNPDCYAKADSIYIDVKLQQGTPSCTITNNTCDFNNQFDDTYSRVREQIDPSYNVRTLEASGTSEMEVLFHPYWNTKEPEDGIYKTINVASFDQLDYNYNKVFVSTIKNSVYFASYEFQTVYVNHVNGKLRVRFCNLGMGGYNGISFTTQASATLTEQ